MAKMNTICIPALSSASYIADGIHLLNSPIEAKKCAKLRPASLRRLEVLKQCMFQIKRLLDFVWCGMLLNFKGTLKTKGEFNCFK
jgi:hypothetical protein